MSLNTFIFMGKPGSGKGVQSGLMSEKFGHMVFSTGGRLREIVKGDSAFAKKTKEVMESGALTPHWLASHLFQAALFSKPDQQGIIFEGGGRTLEEAKLFTEVNDYLGSDFRILFLNVSDETAIKRLTLRGQASGRADDAPEKLQYRIDNFVRETMPAAEFFRSIGKVIDIDGEPAPEVVHDEVMKKLAPFI